RAAHVPMTAVDLGRIEQAAREAARTLWERSPNDVGRIVRRSGVVGGRPVLAGTRMPTSAIWEYHVAGYPREAILREYPGLTPQDVDAAIAFEEGRLAKTG